jgi:ppGpp synthetase/RelA/SpoT-type nucleotidyltranferase
MENYGLDLHGEMLLEEYRQQLPLYKRLMEVMKSKTAEIIKEGELTVASMEFRIKEEASLAGKLQRKGSKYGTLRDITDIFGGRIIMYYNEDVDRVASFVESKLEIDWPNSVDKRKMHEVDSFGYNSLHYICRIPKTFFYDPEYPDLNDIRFEIQMRTALQHVWSAIQHDIGYKSEIETPKEYHRMLSRLAGMMELADDEFSRIRNSIADYRRRMQNLVLNGQLEEVALDGDTFLSYVAMHPFDKLNRKIAAITQAEIQESTFIPYLTVLRQLDIKTLGDVERMMANYCDDAYQLALFQLGSTDIDILASTVGLQNLCFVHILKTGRGIPGLVQMFDAINGRMPQNEDLARMVFEQAARLSFMNK